MYIWMRTKTHGNAAWRKKNTTLLYLSNGISNWVNFHSYIYIMQLYHNMLQIALFTCLVSCFSQTYFQTKQFSVLFIAHLIKSICRDCLSNYKAKNSVSNFTQTPIISVVLPFKSWHFHYMYHLTLRTVVIFYCSHRVPLGIISI